MTEVRTPYPLSWPASWPRASSREDAKFHALIDSAKCRGAFGMKEDQFLHLCCKILWAAIAVVAA